MIGSKSFSIVIINILTKMCSFLTVLTPSSLPWLTSFLLFTMSSDEEPLNGLISKTRECRKANYQIALINYVSLFSSSNLGVDCNPEFVCWYLLETRILLCLPCPCYYDYQRCLSHSSVCADYLIHYRILGSWLLVNHFLVLVNYSFPSYPQTQLLCYLSIFLAVPLVTSYDVGN